MPVFFISFIFYSDLYTSIITSIPIFQGTRLGSLGIQAGPREVLYGCYISLFEFNWLFFGVDIPSLWQQCRLFFPNIAFGSSESSIMNIISYFGFIGVISLLYLTLKSLTYSTKSLYGFILLCLLLRSATGDFFIGNVFDWVYFYSLFFFIDQSELTKGDLR